MSTDKPAISGDSLPDLFASAFEYLVDTGQRSVLFLDVRRRPFVVIDPRAGHGRSMVRPAEWSTSAASRDCGGPARAMLPRASRWRKTIVREQFFMLLLELEASLAAIPKLLPSSEAERRAGLDVIREVLSGSRKEISGETARRFDRVTELFGLTAESQAKAS
jgi:hypothetical protein